MSEQWTPPKCAACSDTGLRTTYLLVTYEGGDRYCHKKTEQISREKYEFISRQLGAMEARGEQPRQKVGTGATRCECRKGAL
jgi:hypothetical protein